MVNWCTFCIEYHCSTSNFATDCLIVGIVAYMAYNHLVVKTDKVVYQMEANSLEFLDHLNEPI